MKKLNLTIALLLVFLANDLTAQSLTYTFNGNGNWSDTANWVNNKLPPTSIDDSSKIIIDPISQGLCVLDVSQTLRPGSQLIVTTGKKFIIQGELVNLSDNKAEVFINAKDPRLAEVKIDSNTRITFFGERGLDGAPQRLVGYSIASISDSSNFDYVSLDDSGRYSNVFLRTGEKMHFDYSPIDSIIITLTGLDSTVQLVKIYKEPLSGTRNTSHRFTFRPQAVLNGADRNVNIKVTKKNTLTGIEEVVKPQETVVWVSLNAYPYRVTAQYDNSTGFYSVKHSEVGINYNDPNVIKNTLTTIKSGLETACKLGNLPLEFRLSLNVFHTAICLSPTPVTLAVCAAWTTFTIGCTASKALDIIDHAIYRLNQSLAIPPISTVKAISSHYTLGTIVSASKTLDQIYLNPSGYDFKLIHLYTLPVLSTTNPTFITSSSAISGGIVTDDGSSPVLQKGVCWSTSQNPVVENNPNKTINGTGTGEFASIIAGLMSGITYHIRAYATNGQGTAYGNEIHFTTGNAIASLNNTFWSGTYVTSSGQTSPFYLKLNTGVSGQKNNILAQWSQGIPSYSSNWQGLIDDLGSSIVFTASTGYEFPSPWTISGNTMSGTVNLCPCPSQNISSIALTKQ